MKTIKDLLAEHPAFVEFNDEQRELIAGCGKIVHFKDGDFLMREGQEAKSFYVIRKGTVSIESYVPTRGPVVFSTEHDRGVIGFSWLFPPHRTCFDCRAVGDVRTIMLDGECLRGKSEEHREMGYLLMKQFAQLMVQRMKAARRQMLNVYAEV